MTPFANPSPAYQRAKNLGAHPLPLAFGEVAELGRRKPRWPAVLAVLVTLAFVVGLIGRYAP